ncbi:hypothetical protein, conserved [Eimeria brunetti]|uniref:Uncharacterized protein n=1 Tax=Eimeria brunetti TaxID=51314 RepID=U6LI87_9EIME|nr:hypothetical protein, conserved [Eimeria brunetti]
MVSKAEAPLNRFLESPQWWPPSDSESLCESSETHTRCTARQAPQERIQQLRCILSEAVFETVGLKTEAEGTLKDHKGDISLPAPLDNGGLYGVPKTKDVPPCFVPFVRFNCNVTLVAQKLFNAAMGVSILCSGTASIGECRESFELQMLKHAKPREHVYVRHVMLTAPEHTYKQQKVASAEPFSYGFLVARLDSLDPQVRDLVVSERMPFGAILDRCGVQRSVETDRQLHVHLRSSFFGVENKQNYFKSPNGTLEAKGNELQDLSLQTSGDCQCKLLPEGSCCTFGRLITVWCDGQPAARVVEILNERFVLRSLLAEEEQKQLGYFAKTADGSSPMHFESRFAFLLGRCLASVALCPVHCKLLPKPHVNTQSLLSVKSQSEGCRLCGSTSCSTDFKSAYTADLQ